MSSVWLGVLFSLFRQGSGAVPLSVPFYLCHRASTDQFLNERHHHYRIVMVRNLQFSFRQYARPVDALVSRVSIQMLCRMGGQESNKHARKKLHAGRGTVGKAVVVGMKDRESNQIRARVVENDDAETLQGFVLDNTTENTEVYTDGSKAYRGVPRPHMAVRHSVGEYVRDLAHTNGLERFAGSGDLLKWDAVPALFGPAHDTPFIPLSSRTYVRNNRPPPCRPRAGKE